MLPPTTQEEIDRRENLSSKIQITTDIMNTLGDIEDNVSKIKILKTLLSNVVNDNEVISILQEYIEKLEEEAEKESEESTQTTDEPMEDDMDLGGSSFSSSSGGLADAIGDNLSTEGEEETPSENDEASGEETILPSPADLELDLTDNNFEA